MLGIETVFKALSSGLDSIPGHSGSDICAFMMWGEDSERDRSYMLGCNEGVGWGATDSHDGANGLMHISESNVRNTPVEILENKAPVEVEKVELRTDSGGSGRQRGGLGIYRSYRFTADTNALVTVKKTKTDGWGISGGQPGARNEVVLRPGTEDKESTGTFRDSFTAGDRLWNCSGGGGGYGNPRERAPEAVREDVLDGYVSREAARETYGVVITDDDTVDLQATRELRAEADSS
jgi:N-methylhydantoinase B